jgi:exonuclease-1
MCVLAGCDFADSLPGIGIKKAHGHLRRTRCFLKVRQAAMCALVEALRFAAAAAAGLWQLGVGLDIRVALTKRAGESATD